MLNYCEFMALLHSFISDINHSLKMLMLNSTSHHPYLQSIKLPQSLQINSKNTSEKYFGSTVLTCAKCNNKIAEEPEWLRTVRTENRLSPDSNWFTDQTTAVVAIQQATWGKPRATPWSFSFLNKRTTVQKPKEKTGRGGDSNPCTTCFPPPKDFT